MKNILKKLFALCLAFAMTATMAGCGDNDENKGDAGAKGRESVVIVGSSSANKLVKALSEKFKDEYKDKYSDLEFNITREDSGTAIDAVRSGKADIGVMSRGITDEEKSLVDDVEVFAMDGIAVITNKECKLNDLSATQVKKIFSGEYENWKDVGGKDAEINVYTREELSGTRNEFMKWLGLGSVFDASQEKKITEKATIYDTSEEVKKAVADDKNGIGYVSMVTADKTVKILTMDGIKINVDNISSADYKLVRNFSFVIAEEESEAADDFIDWVLSAKGQQVIKDEGYIPIK